jgi:hypothetical protein
MTAPKCPFTIDPQCRTSVLAWCPRSCRASREPYLTAAMRASANGPPITLRDPLELGTDTSSPAGDCEDGAWASPHATRAR